MEEYESEGSGSENEEVEGEGQISDIQLKTIVDEYLKKKKERAKNPVVEKTPLPVENLPPEDLKCEFGENEITPEENKEIICMT